MNRTLKNKWKKKHVNLYVRGPDFSKANPDFCHEQALVRRGYYTWAREGDSTPKEMVAPYTSIFPARNATGRHDATTTRHWYRAMTKEEFDYLKLNGVLNLLFEDESGEDDPSYIGIATNAEYVAEYMGYAKSQTHLVEFEVTGDKTFHEIVLEMADERNLPHHLPKAEGNGGTYGLGTKGHYQGAAGDLFNDLLAFRKITWRLVTIHIKYEITDKIAGRIIDPATIADDRTRQTFLTEYAENATEVGRQHLTGG